MTTGYCRYLAVVYPLRYDEDRVKKRLPMIFLCVWIVAFLLTSPGYITSTIDDGVCVLHIYDTKVSGMLVSVFWLITFLVVPSVIMLFCYGHMFLILSGNTSSSSSGNDGNSLELSTSSKRTENLKSVQRNVIQTCAILSLFFMSTYSFLFIMDSLIVFEVIGFADDVWNVAFSTLIINSCVNPFVYTIR